MEGIGYEDMILMKKREKGRQGDDALHSYIVVM